ncbi:hypothetical protein [Maricaulis sp.]|uniref:hypothetical protein n=1 Tax=Maricaulis sp. TaxID=1486257 RepID=UPI003A8CB812
MFNSKQRLREFLEAADGDIHLVNAAIEYAHVKHRRPPTTMEVLEVIYSILGKAFSPKKISA